VDHQAGCDEPLAVVAALVPRLVVLCQAGCRQSVCRLCPLESVPAQKRAVPLAPPDGASAAICVVSRAEPWRGLEGLRAT